MTKAFVSSVDGRISHISRDFVSIRDTLGPAQTHGWSWVCSLFAGAVGREAKLDLDVLDTVLFKNSSPTVWLFTGRNGKLCHRTGRHCSSKKILTAFAAGASGKLHNDEAATVQAHDVSGKVFLLKHFELEHLFERSRAGELQLKDVQCLQRRVDSGKASRVSNFAQYHGEYLLDNQARQKYGAFIVDAREGAQPKKSSSKSHHMIACRSPLLVTSIKRFLSTLVASIENLDKSKVLSLKADFAADANDRTWLVRVSSVEVAKPRVSPVERTVRQFSTPSNMLQRNAHNSGRVQASLAARDAELLQEIGLTGGESVKQIADLALACGDNSSGTEGLDDGLADGRTNYEGMRRSNGTVQQSKTQSEEALRFLGFTKNCPGEFCKVKFELEAGDNCLSTQLVRPTTGMGGSQSAEAYDGGEETARYKVTYKTVLLAKQEKYLVDLLLRRIQRRESEEYVSKADHLELCLLGTLHPEEAYRDVDVCASCYKIYAKIEQARRLATQKRNLAPNAGDDGVKCLDYEKQVEELLAQNTGGRALDSDTLRSQAVQIARYAQIALTRTDIAELSSLSNPPELVKLVSEALMILLHGEKLSWEECRLRLCSTERVFALIRGLDLECIDPGRLVQLERFFTNPDFRPSLVSAVCKAASSICRWVLGVLLANKYATQATRIHPRSDPLLSEAAQGRTQQTDERQDSPDEGLTLPLPKYLLRRVPRKMLKRSKEVRRADSGGEEAEEYVEKGQSDVSSTAAISGKEQQEQESLTVPAVVATATRTAVEELTNEENQEFESSAHDSSSDRLLDQSYTRSIKETTPDLPTAKQVQAKLQQVQMERLCGKGDDAGGPKESGDESVFSTEEGVDIPYAISGMASAAKSCLNLVVCNDLFDTYESLQILVEPLLRRHPGSKALYFNYPGQAYTEKDGETQRMPKLVNNETIARYLHELLLHTETEGSFITSSLPFYLVGFGNGANIMTYFALTYGEMQRYKSSLQGILSINGFLALDPQLTSILHSTIKVFSCFPSSRPDLPVSYFARFLFSEEYLKRVNPNLVLNLYTAVTNPITIGGRIRICKGSLCHKELESKVSSLTIPLIVVQSTENLLVSPSNVDTFLKGRRVTHLWSHQFVEGKLTESAAEQLSKGAYEQSSACVLWIKAGHEIKQEAKSSLIEILHVLLKSSPKPSVKSDTAATTTPTTGKRSRIEKPLPRESRAQEKLARDELSSPGSFKEALEKHKNFKKAAEDSRIKRVKDIEEIEKQLQQSEARISSHNALQSPKAAFSEGKEESSTSVPSTPLPSGTPQGLIAVESATEEHKQDQPNEGTENCKVERPTGLNLHSDALPALSIAQKEAQAVSEAVVENSIREDTESASREVVSFMMQQLEGQSAGKTEVLPVDGVLSGADFDTIRQNMYDGVGCAQSPSPRDLDSEVSESERNFKALKIQKAFRGKQGRLRSGERREELRIARAKTDLALKVQSLERARQARKEVRRREDIARRERLEGDAARQVQCVVRGHHGRKEAQRVRTIKAGKKINRVARGSLARKKARAMKAEKERIEREIMCAIKIQATWRMHASKSRLLHQRILSLAAMQVQRVYRGARGRRRAERKRLWENAEPGAERLQLGIQLIDESKKAFKSQQEEIDSLHRAQERAERRVGEIFAGLKESEAELASLEQELVSINELDKSLFELSEEKRSLNSTQVVSKAPIEENEREASCSESGDGHALELEIHLKRAERERKKKQLEVEFAVAFDQVKDKRVALETLEGTIQDIEATRNRKEREFQRLQRNLMELLEDQKLELENLREKGVELEVATSSSAAAAAATLAAARENESKSKEMFNSTEELLKFQFMSMSLSYFSSMNMIKSLRDINADTTQKAISSTAKTAATAAAVASAANIPSSLTLGTDPTVDSQQSEKSQQVLEKLAKDKQKPLPENVRDWTVEDVGIWLDSLSLSQYKVAFNEASIDGDFLLELRAEDMRDVLGMSHPLHVQKVIVSREKVRPLNEAELRQKKAVLFEQSLETNKQEEVAPIPDVGTVFSQIRNSRFKKVEEALDLGFDPNSLDSNGNTALIVAAQNTNKRIAELLLNRGADINHQNSQGNTPMHYAMAYDPQGTLGEFLIGRGADDTLENQLGLSPYDGIE